MQDFVHQPYEPGERGGGGGGGGGGANVVATAAVIVAVIAMTVPGVKTSPRVLQRLSKLRL